ncbi:hypothetical protein BY458DRAFT_499066 [Sporodiniella umbellata]|nr:hypothetical protein BY458DRAFT_499066 [Sporodiniella umbellata]
MAYTVRINGTVLSSLLFECSNALTDLEGYLLGALSSRVTIANDDYNDQAFEKREDFIIIHGYEIVKDVPYDMFGNNIKQSDTSVCVGYFKYRRQTEVELSVRDQLWMKSFSQTLKHGCMAILSSSLLDEATHTYEFAFWDLKDPSKKLPLEISNISGSSLEYRQFMSNASRFTSASTLVSTTLSDKIMNQCDTIYQESIERLQASLDNVIQKEKELEKLKKEIKAIREPSLEF